MGDRLMSDELSSTSTSSRKSWLNRIIHLLNNEPQDLDELVEILKEAQENRLLDPDALSMIEGVLKVSQMRVRDIMIPRIQMVVVSKDAELESILSLVTEFEHSRYPVIDGDKSKVVGILLTKDLLLKIPLNKNLQVQEIMRPVSVVPESKRLNVLLKELRTQGNHMAIVVDEYGQAAGLVTIEDILEEIVGDIEDEHDAPEEGYVFERKPDEYIVKALMPIDEFDEYFSTQLTTDEYDTVAGFIVHELQHMPKRGERITVDNLRFEVIKADNRRIHLIKLKRMP